MVAMNECDAHMLERAIALAERGCGAVEPNPMVGAVVVDAGGNVVGEGYHVRHGGPHAEVVALAQAGERASGATIYVSLEPCTHIGKTPPCVDAILAAGCGRVVYAMADPNPQAAGGAAALRAAGVDVELVERPAACNLNRAFAKRAASGLPWVTLKWAMTLDGKIATRTGDSQWISGEDSRALVHSWRAHADVVLCGIGTALADDPRLTVRLPQGGGLAGARVRPPARVVLDTAARLPLDSQLVQTARETPVVVAVNERADSARCDELANAGVRVARFPGYGDELDVRSVLALLAHPDHQSVLWWRPESAAQIWPATHVFVEGGASVHAGLLRADAGVVDELKVFVAPKLVGGHSAIGPVSDLDIALMRDALAVRNLTARSVGSDILLEAWLGS